MQQNLVTHTVRDVIDNSNVILIDNYGPVRANSVNDAVLMLINIGAFNTPDYQRLTNLSYLLTLVDSLYASSVNNAGAFFYIIYPTSGNRFAIEINGEGKLYHTRTFEEAKALASTPGERHKYCMTPIQNRECFPAPVYVGFALQAQPVRLPMTLGVTRMTAKAGSKATWDIGAIAEALNNATQSEPAKAEPKDDNGEKLRSNLTAMLKEYEDINTENRPDLLTNIIETVKRIESLHLHSLGASLNSEQSGLPYWFGSFGNAHYQHPMTQLYQFPHPSHGLGLNPTLTSALRQIEKQRQEKKAEAEPTSTVKKPGFVIKHINDFSSVVEDKTFGGTLTLYYANAEEKDKLFVRLGALAELILTGENYIKFSPDILEKGVQDTWVFENVIITGPVMLTGRMVLTNIELTSGSYCEATLAGSK